MSLKYYFDTHIAKQVALQLRNRGVDVLRCEETGMAEASDLAHLEYATDEGRVLVSIDRDFARHFNEWAVKGKRHGGIISVSNSLQGRQNIGRLVTILFEYWQLIETGAGKVEDDFRNQIIFVR